MHRDIQRVFETADDSLHGIIGYNMYVAAMHKLWIAKKCHNFCRKKASKRHSVGLDIIGSATAQAGCMHAVDMQAEKKSKN